ncbi:MAG: enoyl-CoA hydratase-related protein [Smithellaceae bacterium]
MYRRASITPSSTHETLLVKKEDGIATITMNRPDKLKAISFLMFRELAKATGDVARDPEVRTVVVTGAGRAFYADPPEYRRYPRHCR